MVTTPHTQTQTRTRTNSIKVYDGPSLLDGTRIVVIVTGLVRRSANSKTGDMLQTWILRHDVAPNVAVKTGQDSAICGSCPLRPIHHKANGHRLPCYVKTWQAPLSVWKANRDSAAVPLESVPAIVAGRKVRRGSYGDPAAVPAAVWEALSNGMRSTGYTHQWRTAGNEMSRHVLASVHTESEARDAQALGFRTFRVMGADDTPAANEVLCPASKEAGVRSTCATCGLCNGKTGPTDKRRNIAIYIH